MADEKKPKGAPSPDKTEKAEKANKADKADKAAGAPEKAAKAPEKAAKAAKAPRAEKGGRGPKDAGGQTVTLAKERPRGPAEKPRLARFYEEKVRPALVEHFKYGSTMQAPRMTKIVLNMGVGDATQDAKQLEIAMNELAQIAGQKPALRRAKKSISNFKLREGVAIGCAVTLRGARMYEFYDRLVNVAVPRIRDFRGLNPRSFDGRGNYTMGLTEQIIFPEINIEKVGKVRGMDVTIVTSASTDEEGRELLRLMQMPFRPR
jgi:large subunit ribosomal protein L5